MHRSLKSLVAFGCVSASIALGCVAVAAPAVASTRPDVTGLSRSRGPYWGATLVTVRGTNFYDVRQVRFGSHTAYAVHVVSSTKLTVIDPEHGYGTVHVRVVTASGISRTRSVNRFTFTRPTLNTPIMGGLSARQEQAISARIRATHRVVHVARRTKRWTAAMGTTAMKRAKSWLGLPYSWAGGNGSGPTSGVCAHNGGDLDCHVVGFDCSGLSLYAWAPYEQLIHYAATQHARAGRFHPTIGQLMPGDLVFFSGYIAGGIGHVAVYQGHGMVIQAAQSGTEVMRSRLVDVIAESGRYRGATRPMSTGRQGSVPHISSVTTQLPANGGYVRITGHHLATATAVSVGGTMVYSFAKRTGTHLVVKAPAHHSGRVSISVSNPWGTAKRRISYVGAPLISAISPSTGPTTGGTSVTVTGKYLTSVSRVSIGGKSIGFKVVGAGKLTLTTPAHSAQSVPIVLSSAFGSSNQVLFTYGPPAGDSTARGRSGSGNAARTSTRGADASRAARAQSPTHGTAAPVESGTSGDRVGDEWFLVGRRFAERAD